MSNESVTQNDGTTPAAQPGDITSSQRRGKALTPAVDVSENRDGITLLADLPGVSKDRLDIQIDADTLTIEGEIGLDVSREIKAGHTDVGLSRYRRVFTLSKELDADQVSADLRNGVLTLRIPKAAHAQARKIAVQAG